MDPLSIASVLFGYVAKATEFVDKIEHLQGVPAAKKYSRQLTDLLYNTRSTTSSVQEFINVFQDNSSSLPGAPLHSLDLIVTQATDLMAAMSERITQYSQNPHQELRAIRLLQLYGDIGRINDSMRYVREAVQTALTFMVVFRSTSGRPLLRQPKRLPDTGTEEYQASVEQSKLSRPKPVRSHLSPRQLMFQQRLQFVATATQVLSLPVHQKFAPQLSKLDHFHTFQRWNDWISFSRDRSVSSPSSRLYLQKDGAFINAENSLHLVCLNSDMGNSATGMISLDQTTYETLMQQHHLPHDFVIDLIQGTPTFKETRQKASNNDQRQFVLRMPLALTCNWTLAISWDRSTQVTVCLLHGLSSSELYSLIDALQEFRTCDAHVLTMPVVLCQLLTEMETLQIKRHATELHQVEVRTNFLRIEDLNAQDPQSQDTLEELTRKLNAVTSRLYFHRMRLRACSAITSNLDAKLNGLESNEKTAPGKDRAAPFIETLLVERLEHLQAEHSALLLEIECNLDIAKNQLQVVYNLTAQRDNRNSLQLAVTSTEISRHTKDDSFAMRTIAVMTIAFLPATAVSSIFSTTMFDWSPSSNVAGSGNNGGGSVVSPYFWIYWAVSIPLTLLVLGAWWLWIHMHKSREARLMAERTSTLPSNSEMQTISSASTSSRSLRRLLKWRHTKSTVTGPGSTDVEQITNQTSTEINGHEIGQQEHEYPPSGNEQCEIEEPNRADTFIQGPLR